MRKEQRSVYKELAKEIGGSLCTFCNYGDYISEGCCEGWSECQHPIENLSYENKYEDTLEPGGDCYGFRPNMSVRLVTDLTGIILSLGHVDWFYRKYSKESLTVYWQGFAEKRETSGKVRIG